MFIVLRLADGAIIARFKSEPILDLLESYLTELKDLVLEQAGAIAP